MTKKIKIVTACLAMFFGASNAFAGIKLGSTPQEPFNGDNFVGEIVAAFYDTYVNKSQKIHILAKNDGKSGSNLKGLTLVLDENDLPFGQTLASSVGKKIAVLISPNYNVDGVYITTDEFWYGDETNLKRLRKK